MGTHVRGLARDLAGEHTVGIVAPRLTISHFQLDLLADVAVAECPISTHMHPRDLACTRKLRRAIRRFSPDIIHAHGFRAGLLTLLAARGQPGAVVVSWHNQATGSGARRALQERVERFIARRAHLVLGASEDLADRAREVGGRRVAFAPVAAPLPAQLPPGEAPVLRRELLTGAPDGALLVLMVGRVAPQKNYDLLIDAGRHLTDVPAHVVIAGAADPAVRGHLRERIEREDLGEFQISFLGPREDVTALMAAADVYLLTSHWEARALVLQEALVAGLPIIASEAGGIPGLIAGAGVLIDPHTLSAAEDFARAIRDLRDPAAREPLSRRARKRAAELPDERAVAATIEGHYRDLSG